MPDTDCRLSMSWKTLADRLEEIAQAFQSPDGGSFRAANLLGRLQAEINHRGMSDWIMARIEHAPRGDQQEPDPCTGP
jgi:hypothetical protein